MRALKILSSVMLVVLLIAHPVAMAQEAPRQSATSYVPRLSDLMVVIQIRHSKLLYAVKARNWPLADFELGQLVSSLKEVERYYPATLRHVTRADEIGNSLSEAIKAKDEAKFDRAFDEMNDGCNRCHVAEDRAFIVIRRPSYPSAFSDQQYSPPRASERQK